MKELQWHEMTRPDGVRIVQALARNNSWYMLVRTDDLYEVRYASQAGNYLIASGLPLDTAQAEAQAHAARYDNFA